MRKKRDELKFSKDDLRNFFIKATTIQFLMHNYSSQLLPDKIKDKMLDKLIDNSKLMFEELYVEYLHLGAKK